MVGLGAGRHHLHHWRKLPERSIHFNLDSDLHSWVIRSVDLNATQSGSKTTQHFDGDFSRWPLLEDL